MRNPGSNPKRYPLDAVNGKAGTAKISARMYIKAKYTYPSGPVAYRAIRYQHYMKVI